MIDFTNVIARRKLGAPEGWEWFKWEKIGNDSLCEGAVPAITPEGKKKWPKGAVTQKVVVTREEVVAERKAYEERTGLCSRCQGTKQEMASAFLVDGKVVKTYRPCPECKGAGTANGR